MQLVLKPSPRNAFPIGALLIRGADAAAWLYELQQLQLSLNQATVYPVPGPTANSVWGCLVIPARMPAREHIGRHELCQQVTPNLFIPEKAVLHPAINATGLDQLLSADVHIFHPETGLAALTEQPGWQQLLELPTAKESTVTRPRETGFIPQQVRSFRVQPVSPEEALKNMQDLFPEQENMEEKPLSLFEKMRLAVYKKLFMPGKETSSGKGMSTGRNRPQGGFWSALESLLGRFPKLENKWTEKIKQDFEDLEERNKSQVDRLLDMLKNNPEEALKYAPPLDEHGSSRGTNNGLFDLSKQRNDLSMWADLPRSGGGSVDLGDHYYELQKQYNQAAEALIAQKEYQKAAFVYMRLLKSYHKAAETLMAGGFYQEAASVYLKHTFDKKSAAACYERGNMIHEAIELYKELDEFEKLGELYTLLNKRQEANIYYGRLADSYKGKYQYIKAAQVYKEKMLDEAGGQTALLEGWRSGKDAFNCLNNYFAGIADVKQLGREIETVYQADVTPGNGETFLKVLRYEYTKDNELAERLKDIAYEVIAAQVAANPSIITELKEFNINDKELLKDTIRFKVTRKSNR